MEAYIVIMFELWGCLIVTCFVGIAVLGAVYEYSVCMSLSRDVGRRGVSNVKIKGVLLLGFDGTTFFRVYGKGHKFVDYDIRAADVSIEIDDAFVCLKQTEFDEDGNGAGILDYTDEVLGKVKR
jgi:hypothetical protein